MFLLEVTSATTSPVDAWGELAKLGITAVLMGMAIVWLVKQLKFKDKIIKAKDLLIEKTVKDKDDKLEELNDYIRENDKENLQVLTDLNQTIDKMIDTQKSISDKTIDNQNYNTESLGKEIKNLKELIEVKIDNITNKIDGK